VDKNAPTSYQERFRLVVKIMFLIFAALTVASVFVESLSLWKCFTGLAVLYLVKSSADYMAETKKG